MWFSPQRRAIFQHLNFKKWSETLSFFFNISTATCASRHSGVQFFNISTSKSAPKLTCFVHFDFKMCFSPHRHRNGKKWSGPDMFCTFSLENALLATAACKFLISPLTTWLRTRRFSEPTFRLTRRTNHWENAAFRDFSNIWRGCIFFLLTFALLHLLSSDFTFFWLYFIYLLVICFSTLHIVGRLLFKLPSMKGMSAEHWCCTTALACCENPEKSYIWSNCDIVANLCHPQIVGFIPTFQICLDRSPLLPLDITITRLDICIYIYIYMFQVPGPPPTPPAMVMVITHQPPPPPCGMGGPWEGVGVIQPPTNSNVTGRIRWRMLISGKTSMYAEIRRRKLISGKTSMYAEISYTNVS